jgi:hypothetical protein
METMKATWVVCVALASAAGCGGRQMLDEPPDATTGGGAAGASAPTFTIGPVDLTEAPAQLTMSCDGGVGMIAIDNPCLVGHSLGGGNGSDTGAHEIECTLATSVHPIAWSFLLFIPVMQNPVTLFPETPSGLLVDVGGHQARVSGTSGAMTFIRVDPSNQAFVARFDGSVTWTEPSGATFSCSVDGPLWGAPGGFE